MYLSNSPLLTPPPNTHPPLTPSTAITDHRKSSIFITHTPLQCSPQHQPRRQSSCTALQHLKNQPSLLKKNCPQKCSRTLHRCSLSLVMAPPSNDLHFILGYGQAYVSPLQTTRSALACFSSWCTRFYADQPSDYHVIEAKST